MTTSLAQITIARHDGGWHATCDCGWTVWRVYRASVDVAAWEHRRECGGRRG